VACRLLLPDEAIYRDLSLAEAAEMDFPQPNVVLVERTATRRPAFGLEDGEYIQRSPEKG
jgi:precorrin-6Y C5,15-methyltransferase (decarboxylating)